MAIPDAFRALFPDSETANQPGFDQAVQIRISEGEVVFTPGTAIPGVPMVISGKLRVFSPDDSGHEITLYEIQPGETCVLAASSALAGNGYPAIAIAEMDTEAWVVPVDTFLAEFARNERFRAFVFDALNSRLSTVMGLVRDVAFKRMDQRLAGYLSTRTVQDPLIKETHESIALQLGTAREVVSRILNDFEDQGLVRTGRGNIMVIDRSALERITREQTG